MAEIAKHARTSGTRILGARRVRLALGLTAASMAGTAALLGAASPANASGVNWDAVAQCESSGNWGTNTGNGFYGGLQFTASTWHAMGGSGLPHQASRETQIAVAKKLQARAGWGQWPGCTSKLGLR